MINVGILIVAGALVTGAAPSQTAFIDMVGTSNFAPSISEAMRATQAGFAEDFETYSLGELNGQSGWTSWISSVESYGDEPRFDDRTVMIGTDPEQTIFGQVYSPTIPHMFGVVAIDLLIIGDEDYAGVSFEVSDADSLIPNTRLFFHPDGAISAAQSDGPHSVIPASTGGHWTSGVVMQMGVEVLPSGMLNVYQDGQLVFTGHDVNHELGTGFDGLSRPVGIINYGGATVYFDNITDTLVPAPGASVFFSVAALAAVRTRRRSD